MNIKKISSDINRVQKKYNIGELQEFRVKAKNLTRPKSYSLFPREPIHQDWTFHNGGRNELQFNLGNEDEGLRFGFAFALQPSQSLPNPEILYPKVRRLNYIIRSKPELFVNFKMWIWSIDGRSDIHSVKEIAENDICPDNFIFIGKVQEKYNLNEIMNTFDALFPVYKEVESSELIELKEDKTITKFEFKKTKHQLPKIRYMSTIAKEIDISVRHSLLQEKLLKILFKKYKEENVTAEHYLNGNRIDIVVRDNENIIFYEIKIANTAKDCIREALGQLFEYSYYPNTINANKLVVVGESKEDVFTREYITFLNSNFNIPIEYLSIPL